MKEILDLKIEKTSNDTYLRKNKLSSPLFRNLNVLENTFGVNLSSDKVIIKYRI